jgi:transcriptional regulator with XRE-family HTH domain
MNIKNTFSELLKLARTSIAYKAEGVILDVTEQIVERMQELGISKSELAKQIGSSPPYVTKLLRGGTNFTLESMVKVADALDSELKVKIEPKVSARDWFGLLVKAYPNERTKYKVRSQMKNLSCSERENLQSVNPPIPPQHLYQESS